MYQTIFNFIMGSLIGGGGASEAYLAQILTHSTLIMMYIIMVWFVIKMFKIFGGLFKW